LARFGEPLKPVQVALLGCGTVGEGVVKLMRRNAALHERKLGAPLELAGVADRSLRPIAALGLTAKLITRDAAALVVRPDVDIVVELFGRIEPARSLILKALEAGKDVVTANKALLAEHGDRIFAAAACRSSARCAKRWPATASARFTESSTGRVIRSSP